MLHLMRRKVLFFVLSSLVILPGLFYLMMGGLKPGIDFTGGALLEYTFHQQPNLENLRQFGTVTPVSDTTYIIRTQPSENKDESQDQYLKELKTQIQQKVGPFDVRSEENIGPVIGKELTQRAIGGTLAACIMIVLYITYTFRKVPKPASSLRFGVSAVVALVHDVLVLVGLFAIFGHFLHVEIDTLFVTAVLTVIGFSVHDTIVVFDRIRENMPRHLDLKFSDVADISIVQTLGRSLNTSLTVVLVLLALFLFGGESIKWFVVALLIGIVSGTYSSIFNATALLCWWEERLGH